MTRLLCSLTLLLSLCSHALTAQAYDLTITYGNEQHSLSQQQLVNISEASLTTVTPWTDESSTYQGLPLSVLMEHFNIQSRHVQAKALNEYQITIDLQQANKAGAFVASFENGQPMKVRNKGPFWLIFPWNQPHIMKDKRFHDWAIWQLNELTFESTP